MVLSKESKLVLCTSQDDLFVDINTCLDFESLKPLKLPWMLHVSYFTGHGTMTRNNLTN